MTHFVYPYSIPRDPRFGWELVYSLRSIYQFYKDPFDITIIGEIPSWINTREVKCIELYNSDPVLFPRVQSRTNEKILTAAEIYDDIVVMHDDYYLIDNCYKKDFTQIRYLSNTMHYNFSEEESKRLTMFQKQLRYTSKRLKSLNKSYTINFATHAPFYYESNKLNYLQKIFPLVKEKAQEAPVLEVAYYNYFLDEIGNIVHLGDFRAGFWYDKTQGDLNKAKILNHDEKGFIMNPSIMAFLLKLFPQKCPAEDWRL